jgi:translation initiation factor 2B subunit (eIF-2B alpha/beta/delta family)
MVILHCSCVLANGDCVVPMGAALVALTARHHNIPVLVLAPTDIFVDKVNRRRSLETNLRRNNSQITSSESAQTSSEHEILACAYISALITELRLLPASSAPAVLRINQLFL